jgi:hypothetical protein
VAAALRHRAPSLAFKFGSSRSSFRCSRCRGATGGPGFEEDSVPRDEFDAQWAL